MKTYYCQGENISLKYPRSISPITATAFSFSLPKGQITALVGPNGCGKSTLLKSLLKEPLLYSGNILFENNQSLSALNLKDVSKIISYVPQEHYFAKELSGVDFLRMAFLPTIGWFGELPSRTDRRILEMIDCLQLNGLQLKALGKMSAGERQRFFLARSLLENPKILVLDEPTNHLDPGAIDRFWNALLGRQKIQSFEVLISTHDWNFINSNCDYLLALRKGNKYYEGTVSDFNSDLKKNLYD